MPKGNKKIKHPEFLSELKRLTDDLPDPDKLDTSEKIDLVVRLRSIGCPVRDISKYLGCNASYVYRLIEKSHDAAIQSLEEKTFLTHFVERRESLLAQIDYYKRVQAGIRDAPKASQEKDEDGNYIDDGKMGSIRDLKDIGSLIVTLEKTLISLDTVAGILPDKNTSAYGSLSDARSDNSSDADDVTQLGDDELTALLLKKLQQGGRSMQDTSLAGNKDKSILG